MIVQTDYLVQYYRLRVIPMDWTAFVNYHKGWFHPHVLYTLYVFDSWNKTANFLKERRR